MIPTEGRENSTGNRELLKQRYTGTNENEEMEMENAESLKMSLERRLRCGHLFVGVNAKSPQNCAISTDLTLLRLALEPKEVDQTLHHCHRWRLDLWRLQRASKRRGRELRVNRREQRANPSRAIVKGGGGGF